MEGEEGRRQRMFTVACGPMGICLRLDREDGAQSGRADGHFVEVDGVLQLRLGHAQQGTALDGAGGEADRKVGTLEEAERELGGFASQKGKWKADLLLF